MLTWSTLCAGLVELLLNQNVNVVTVTESRDTPLHAAVFGNRPEIMNSLIRAGRCLFLLPQLRAKWLRSIFLPLKTEILFIPHHPVFVWLHKSASDKHFPDNGGIVRLAICVWYFQGIRMLLKDVQLMLSRVNH